MKKRTYQEGNKTIHKYEIRTNHDYWFYLIEKEEILYRESKLTQKEFLYPLLHTMFLMLIAVKMKKYSEAGVLFRELKSMDPELLIEVEDDSKLIKFNEEESSNYFGEIMGKLAFRCYDRRGINIDDFFSAYQEISDKYMTNGKLNTQKGIMAWIDEYNAQVVEE